MTAKMMPQKMTFSIPEFPKELSSIQAYECLIENTFIVLLYLQKRIDQLLELDILAPTLEEDVRSARGKLILLTQKRLKMFRKLTKEVSKDQQGINDLSGFWATCFTEIEDLKRSCDKVEEYHQNNWQPIERK